MYGGLAKLHYWNHGARGGSLHFAKIRGIWPKLRGQKQIRIRLAYYLTAPRITTRSQYRRVLSNADTRLLTSTRYRPQNTNLPANGPLSAEEEAQLLEHLILTRRSQSLPRQSAAGTWREGAAGMGQGGPQCIVCQSSPRTILAWPCRCLSLCEECRLSLAINNFGTCVCCRQDVVGFSTLFVP